jgi:hypothetical protein
MTICVLVIINRRSHDKTFLSGNERLSTSTLYSPLRGARYITPVSILVASGSYGRILKVSRTSGCLHGRRIVVLGCCSLRGFVSYNISAIISSCSHHGGTPFSSPADTSVPYPTLAGLWIVILIHSHFHATIRLFRAMA